MCQFNEFKKAIAGRQAPYFGVQLLFSMLKFRHILNLLKNQNSQVLIYCMNLLYLNG